MADRQHNLAAQVFSIGAPEAVVLREGERVWTRAQLADIVAGVSSALTGLGIARGERVAILMRDTLEAAAVILGVIHAGAVAAPLSELARADDLRHYLVHADAVAAIVDGELEPAIDQIKGELARLREVVCVTPRAAGEHELAALIAAAPRAEPAAVEPDDECLLLYSAAFLDEPRGVRHSHASILAAHRSFATWWQLAAGDRVFSVTRLSTAVGIGCGLVFPLLAGAEALLLPEQPQSRALLTAIERYRPNFFVSTPSVFGQLARDVLVAKLPPPFTALRGAIAGGEGMPEQLVTRIRTGLGVDVMVGYGLTEVMQIAIAGPTSVNERAGACGKPLPGIEARIINESGGPPGTDEIGTLQLRAPSMCAGYWYGPSGVAPEADGLGADGWLTTRDRFLVDERGIYHHCGRSDDLFKVGGKWVSPVEVERALISHEAVWEAAVIGADNEDGLIKPLAFVVINVGKVASPSLEIELRDFVKRTLAPYKYPRWIEFVDALPRGPGGKLLRYKLRPPRRRRRAETGNT